MSRQTGGWHLLASVSPCVDSIPENLSALFLHHRLMWCLRSAFLVSWYMYLEAKKVHHWWWNMERVNKAAGILYILMYIRYCLATFASVQCAPAVKACPPTPLQVTCCLCLSCPAQGSLWSSSVLLLEGGAQPALAFSHTRFPLAGLWLQHPHTHPISSIPGSLSHLPANLPRHLVTWVLSLPQPLLQSPHHRFTCCTIFLFILLFASLWLDWRFHVIGGV